MPEVVDRAQHILHIADRRQTKLSKCEINQRKEGHLGFDFADDEIQSLSEIILNGRISIL
jgi:hypothetical protein